MASQTNLLSRFPSFVGFDDIFRNMESILENGNAAMKAVQQTWPPYNVVKTGEHTYKVQLALAGFSKTDIDIELSGNTLRVKGETKPEDNVTYITKGIAERAFSRQFTLADSVEVKNAEMVNGILEIILENQAKAIDHIKKIAVK